MSDRTDTERLDWLEAQGGAGLISDDAGHWAVEVSGIQNVPDEALTDIDTTFWIKKDKWRDTIRGAIDAAIVEEAAGR